MDKEQNDIVIYSTSDGKTSVPLMTHDGKEWLNKYKFGKI